MGYKISLNGIIYNAFEFDCLTSFLKTLWTFRKFSGGSKRKERNQHVQNFMRIVWNARRKRIYNIFRLKNRFPKFVVLLVTANIGRHK